MTAEERAAKTIFDAYGELGWGYDPNQHQKIQGYIASAIRNARNEALEEAAAVAESLDECAACVIEGQPCNIPEAAARIRALKDKP